MPPTLVSQPSYKRVPIPLPKKTRGRARRSMGRKGRKGTRRRRGGMFGMNSGLSQAEKDAISKRSTYGDLPPEAVATVKDYGSQAAVKKLALSQQMMQGYTGQKTGNTLRNSIMAKTGRRA